MLCSDGQALEGFGMAKKSQFISIAAVLLFTTYSADDANAFEWCSLASLVPAEPIDIQRYSSEVARISGCAPIERNSVTRLEWSCPDRTGIHFYKDRSNEWIFFVETLEQVGASSFSKCIQNVAINPVFDPLNVSRSHTIQPKDSRPFLVSQIPGFSTNVYQTSLYGEVLEREFIQYQYGIETPTKTDEILSTEVRIAQLNPITSEPIDIVNALVTRGSRILSRNDENGYKPSWTLSPPTGLPGVSSVEVVSFVRSTLAIKYNLTDTGSYERFIGVLDSEYGESQRRRSRSGCISRIWVSGKMQIEGYHCSANSNRLVFFNTFASDALQQVLAKIDSRNHSKSKNRKPVIDNDLY